MTESEAEVGETGERELLSCCKSPEGKENIAVQRMEKEEKKAGLTRGWMMEDRGDSSAAESSEKHSSV